jgi:cytochrome c peroxidase
VVAIYSCTDKGFDIKPTTQTLDLSSSNLSYRAKLGRVLFYDTHLSINNSISCGSCHKQLLGFSDNVSLSSGFENKLTVRNVPPIQNISFENFLFWDGRETQITNMVLKPIFNHAEMGMYDDLALIERLKALPYYSDLFKDAFSGSDAITLPKIASALTSFIGNFSSSQTRFDKFLNGETNLTGVELEGKQLFFEKYKCNSCHQVEMPTGYETSGNDGFLDIGLDVNYSDNGRSNVTSLASDIGKFRTPSLRNVVLTAPYMHDGRFASLDNVLDHYSNGIANHINLDPRLKDSNGIAIRMNFTNDERIAIKAFLSTLSDYSTITNKDFASPFK